MQVNAATTFTQIHNELQQGGEFANAPAAKNLRLDTKSGLHLHRTDKGSGINFIKRAEKHEAAVGQLKSAIDNELGPGAGATVLKNLGLKSEVSIGDMTAIKTEVDRLKRLAPVLPAQGFQLSPVRGDPSLVAGDFNHTMGHGEVASFTPKLDHNLQNHNNPAPGAANVTAQFMADYSRMNIHLVDGNVQQKLPQGLADGALARGTLSTYCGNDATATRALSNFLTQTAFNTMHGELGPLLQAADGHSVNVGIAPPAAGQAKNQTVTVRTDGPNHLLIDFKMDGNARGMANGGSLLDLSAEGRSTLGMTMQLRVATDDLAAGRLDYQVTRPPSFALHAEFNPGRDMM